MTLSQRDFLIWQPLTVFLLFFGKVLLYPLKSILFAVDPQWVHNPLSSGVIWEDIQNIFPWGIDTIGKMAQ
jgi:hypothetical protein